MIHRLLFILLTFWSFGCSNSLESPIDPAIYGYEYFPLEVGKYRIYQVDSIQFDIGAGNLPIRDSSTFYLREEVKELVQDFEEADVFRIERSRSDQPTGPWQIWDVVTASRSVNQAFYTENNIRLINLVFPLSKGIRWNGTSFINDQIIVFIRGESVEMYKGWEFEVLEEGMSEQIGSVVYPEVATVQQSNSENIIERRYSVEKYAKGVGLIFQERQIVDSYCKYLGITEPCIGKEWIEKSGRGFFSRQSLLEYN